MSKNSLRFQRIADMPAGMRALYERQAAALPPAPPAPVPAATESDPLEPVIVATARSRAQHDADAMNKTEAAYAQHLEARKACGEVLWWVYEHINLRLAHKTFYRVDFFVHLADGSLEAHEVKGFWEDDARVKIKVAARLYPFRFIAVTRKRGEWRFEVIAP